MSKALLYDATMCIGCKQCEVACAEQNKLPYDDKIAAESVQSEHKYTVVMTKNDKFMRRLCMHCEHPACASACPVGAFHKTKDGPVVYDVWKCIGCRYCMVACAFAQPKYEWHSLNPRVPLSGILTYAKLLRKWVGSGQAEHEKRDEAMRCLELIAAESRRCGDLIKNLLGLSRTAPMNVQSTHLHDVIDRCLLLVRHQLELNAIDLQQKRALDLPLVSCDAAQIEQVLLALIMNAIDAMPHGGSLWIETRLSPDDAEVEIKVRDDGVGIAPDVLPQVFEPFVTTKENGSGVGLGLAISRGIVESHHGRIEVQSELGRGATFTVTLPTQARDGLLASVGDAAMKMR